jgi:hypothetical protein
LGRDYGTELEVLDGITSTDRIVADPNDDITDGGLVKVVPGEKD